MKSCPNCQLSFDDISYNFCLEDGSQLIILEEPEIETVISHRTLKINSIPDSLPTNNSSVVIIEPVIAINIAQQYPYVQNSSELYEVTRGLWRLSRPRAEKSKYAFAVFRGTIKEVYEIQCWEPAHIQSNEYWIERKRLQGEAIDPSINNGRFQFFGQIAPDFIRLKYVDKQLPVAYGQNPIRYFNC